MNDQQNKEVLSEVACYHCGQPCNTVFYLDKKPFCCFGCKTVYEILSERDLCTYYTIDTTPGSTQRNLNLTNYSYLDKEDVYKEIVEYDSPEYARVRWSIPNMHCSSCIWLLENLRKFDNGIIRSEINFTRKNVTIDFNPKQVALSKLADILQSIGYSPAIEADSNEKKTSDYTPVLKLALAGFCFGNVMLFSFPEYLGITNQDQTLRGIFTWLNLLLAIPVLVYSASHYFVSAWKSFSQKQINIDVPIAVGLLALFLRSAYDIITSSGSGYLDSFTGLVFFLLIGRWFQSKTYESLAFDRDFKSYFPLAVNKSEGDDYISTRIHELIKGDRIRIRNLEIIPADSILKSDEALIDYSFVTGESKPVRVGHDELVYAGGRLLGQTVELIVERKTSQSSLTSLWNHEAFRKREESKYQKIIDNASRKFTWIVLVLAACTALYWQYIEPDRMWLVLTSVLMVACPCALALAAPFTYGSMMRVFGKHKFYLKNADVIERMAAIDAVVFDKTGTITYGQKPSVSFSGELGDKELSWVKSLTASSTHPLSVMIHESLPKNVVFDIDQFNELPGKGIEGRVDNHLIRIGSAVFVGFHQKIQADASRVFVSIDHDVKGFFTIALRVRESIKDMLTRLGERCVGLLSGDQDTEQNRMRVLFGRKPELLFNQTPQDKLAYISELQHTEKRVMMVGDGLNDAGAMKQSDVGIAVTDNTGIFTPACDGILHGDQIGQLDKFLSLARASSTILKIGFGISFFYNAITLSIAITGHLTPIVAAILMPISSISVVGFSSISVRLIAQRRLGMNKSRTR